MSWDAISDDLTLADPDTMGVSGPLTMDTAGAEMYATIFSFLASTHRPGTLMTGSDDGLVHRTHDDGATWEAVTPPDLPKYSQVTMLARVTPYRRHALHDGGPPQDGRLRTLRVPHHRLGQLVGADRRRRTRGRVLPRDPRRPAPPWAAVPRDRVGPPRELRWRHPLAAAPGQPAGHAGVRPPGEGHGPAGGHPWPLVLDSRRRDPAAPGRRPGRIGHNRTAAVPAP